MTLVGREKSSITAPCFLLSHSALCLDSFACQFHTDGLDKLILPRRFQTTVIMIGCKYEKLKGHRTLTFLAINNSTQSLLKTIVLSKLLILFGLWCPIPMFSRYKISRRNIPVFFWGHPGTVQLVQGYTGWLYLGGTVGN